MDTSAVDRSPLDHAVSDLTWYVAYTGVRQELKAAQGLEEAGYARFLPMVKLAELPNVYRRRPRYRALFPRYCFFGFSPYGRYTSGIADVDGVHGILTAGGKWLQVPPHMLAPLMLGDALGVHDERPRHKVIGPKRRRRPRRAPNRIRRDIRRLAQWLEENRRRAS